MSSRNCAGVETPYQSASDLLARSAGQVPALQWSLLALDGLVVGALAVIVPAIQVRIARHIAQRRGTGLLDQAVRA